MIYELTASDTSASSDKTGFIKCIKEWVGPWIPSNISVT